MRENDIREAYDSMNPSDDSRERMLQSILMEGEKPMKKFTAQPTNPKWWTAIPAAVALIAVVIMGVLILKGPWDDDGVLVNPEDNTVTEPDTMEEEPTVNNETVPAVHYPEPHNVDDLPTSYEQVLQLYAQAAQENWDTSKCYQMGISTMAAQLDELDGAGYSLIDLDGNGIDELVISVEGNVICDIYTQADSGVQWILTSGDGEVYTMCMDNVIARKGSISELETAYIFYRWDGNEFVALHTLIHDATGGESVQWYLKEGSEKEKISEAEAQEIITSYVPTTWERTPLEEFQIHYPNDSVGVYPLPNCIDLSNLDNHTLAVSLEKGDAYVDDAGVMQMKVTVYDYELYDMVDISLLEVGSTIVIRGREVEISAIQHTDSGDVLINGGLSAGGHTLRTDENTVYYEVDSNGDKCWYAAGEATIPVSADFVYTDSSDPNQEPVVFYPGDFLTECEGLDYFFAPNNTRIVIEKGCIVEMERVYTEAAAMTWEAYSDFIADRVENVDDPDELYYYLKDFNGDGIVEMLIGYSDHLEIVYTMTEGYINFLQMTDSDWQTADEIWADASITPITQWDT